MSTSTYASIFVGALLSEKEIMKRFGEGYAEKIHLKCPKDKMVNVGGGKFCADCGTDLRYKEKTKDGLESIDTFEYLPAVEKRKLDVEVLSKYSNNFDGVLVGKRVVASENICRSGELLKADVDFTKIVVDVERRISELGIGKTVKTYLVTTIA